MLSFQEASVYISWILGGTAGVRPDSVPALDSSPVKDFISAKKVAVASGERVSLEEALGKLKDSPFGLVPMVGQGSEKCLGAFDGTDCHKAAEEQQRHPLSEPWVRVRDSSMLVDSSQSVGDVLEFMNDLGNRKDTVVVVDHDGKVLGLLNRFVLVARVAQMMVNDSVREAA